MHNFNMIQGVIHYQSCLLAVSNFVKSKHAPPQVHNSNVKCTTKAKLIPKRVEVSSKSNSMYTTCSGHISKPAKRLITQM